MTSLRSIALGLACAALAAGVLAGCGGGGDDTTTTSSTIPTVSSTTPLPKTTTTAEDRGHGKSEAERGDDSGGHSRDRGGVSGSASSGNPQHANLATCRKNAKAYREYLNSDIATNRAEAVAKLRKLLAKC